MTKRLKHLLRLQYGDSLAADVRESGDVLVYGSNGPVGEHNARNMLSPAIVVGRKGSHGKVSWASEGGFCIDTALFVDHRTCKGDLRYAYYLFQTLDLEEPSKDSAVPGLDRFEAHRKPIPDIDLKTQKAIADFLDRETARIDQLIEKKERQDLALEEEHQAFVTMAVTKGLDSVPMSLTANTWLKEIPAHWNLSRLKFVCARIVDCLHETPEHSESGDYASIRTADVIRGRLLLDQAKRVSEEEYLTRIQRLEPAEGDILYTREGERFGLAALVPPGAKLCLGQRIMMFRTNRRVLPAFLGLGLN